MGAGSSWTSILTDDRRLARHDRYALISTFGGAAFLTVLSVLQFQEPTVVHWLLGFGGVLLTTGATGFQLVRGNIARNAKERETRRRLAEGLMEASFDTAVQLMSRRPDVTGGIVYLPDGGGVLRPTFLYRKEGEPEDHPSFEKWVGCTGHAWGERAQRSADLAEVTDDELRTTWKLSANTILLTRHLKVIVSTPIWTTESPQRLVGIVSIDSEVPDAECRLLSPKSRRQAQRHAAQVALILELAELV
ncbi:MAG: hypothetical protein ACRDJN_31380 [Chloroflexota bacterium]